MNDTLDHLEIEVKFHIADPEHWQQHLVKLGANPQPKVFETNLRFEDPGQTLKAGQKLLRLRHDTTCRLTYKSKPAFTETECKSYQELEVAVSDFDTMKAILEALGYRQAQIYEKWRQVFHWKNVELCMDTMPYGSFLEIEGAETDIKTAARHLDLSWHQRILTNYLAMFETLKNQKNLPFQDVTFANFEKHPADITPLLGHFEAGATA